MVDSQSQSRLAKLAGTAAALVAAAVAQKVVAAGWKATKGHTPPSAENPDAGIGLGEVLAAAAITGALVALARVLATRGTATFAARIDAARPS